MIFEEKVHEDYSVDSNLNKDFFRLFENILKESF